MKNLSINIMPNWEEGKMELLEVNSGLAASDGMIPFYWENDEISDTLGVMMVEYIDLYEKPGGVKVREVFQFNNEKEFQCILDKGVEFIDITTNKSKFDKISLLDIISYEKIKAKEVL